MDADRGAYRLLNHRDTIPCAHQRCGDSTTELLGEPNISDDGIINQFVILHRVSVYETDTNMYGEASEGKVYKRPVKLPCIVDAEDFDFQYTDFGPDNKQNVSFAFQRAYLVEVDLKPDIGDILQWNEGYFEVILIMKIN